MKRYMTEKQSNVSRETLDCFLIFRYLFHVKHSINSLGLFEKQPKRKISML